MKNASPVDNSAMNYRYDRRTASLCLSVLSLGYCPWHGQLPVELTLCRIKAHEQFRKDCEQVFRSTYHAGGEQPRRSGPAPK
jgi:hypothetical protein